MNCYKREHIEYLADMQYDTVHVCHYDAVLVHAYLL